MRLYRLAIFIASILLVDAAYLSGNLSISYDPKPTLMFSTFAVKVDAKPNDKGCYIHKMAAGETCAYLIDKFTNVKSISNLNSWNKDTPGWEGCDNGHPWAGDEVCVSTGGYPDKRPSKNSDGSCKIHVIKSGESCGVLDKMYYLKPGDMYKFNEDNPNWVSCQDGRPWVGDRVCVSEGTPPSKDVTTNPDGSCYSHELKAGETCADMDKMYGLGPGDMYTFNENTPRWTNCQSLYEGLNVCVSKGTPAGNSVSKNKDGSCYVHTVSKGETCGSIDKLYKLNGGDNYKFNKNTYMWQGCKNNHPWVGDKICVTEGNPPKPPINPEAECGPTAAGDEYDVKCPLNACCSQFGFCGLTSEFCEKEDSLTGAPGTAGCISNCGYGHLHTDTRADFNKIVYWMDSDGKMASDPKELENDYDIMHYAFVNINSDFSIDDSKIKASDFLNLNMKRVASFGGWDFSTNPSTYKIFRNIVSSSGNREKFATNVVNFLKKYNLDGIDLDWEYPGAPDIPGIPADNPTNGKNYNELLKLIKSKLPSGKTLSIAIPASYWYLKNYPIKDMQANIDYQVFMTYDIHGTWDLDKDPHVKCHTNKTEVIDALKMLDKAGVQIGKTYGGLANYGRSYKLSSSSCTGVGCLFSGGGDKGPITETAGVLALSEIDDINSWATKGKRWTDDKSQCDFMTYNDNSIVAWPKAGQRKAMEDMFHNSGLKGSVLWAGNYFKHDEYDSTDIDLDFEWDTDLGMYKSNNDYANLFECENIKLDKLSNLDSLPFGCKIEGLIDYTINLGSDALKIVETLKDDKNYNKNIKAYIGMVQDNIMSNYTTYMFNAYDYKKEQNTYLTCPKNKKCGEYITDAYINACINYNPFPSSPISPLSIFLNNTSPSTLLTKRVDTCFPDDDGVKFDDLCKYCNPGQAKFPGVGLVYFKDVKDKSKSDIAEFCSKKFSMSLEADDFEIDSWSNINMNGMLNTHAVSYDKSIMPKAVNIIPDPMKNMTDDYLDTIQKLISQGKKEIGTENPSDILEALMPLTVFASVSENMKEMNDQGKKIREIEEKERKMMIFTIVTTIVGILTMPLGIAGAFIDVLTVVVGWGVTGEFDPLDILSIFGAIGSEIKLGKTLGSIGKLNKLTNNSKLKLSNSFKHFNEVNNVFKTCKK